MILRSWTPALAFLSAAALSAPGSVLAAGQPSSKLESTSVNCGGSGVDSLYCIPEQSVFSFDRVGRFGHCSIKARFTVEPKIKGLRGHAHLELRGTDPQNRMIDRTARPLVGGGAFSHVFEKLREGHYRIGGWYEGDGTRLASAHRSKRIMLRCA